MAGGYQHTPQNIDALVAELKRLRRDVDSLRSAAPARNTTVSGGSGFIVKDGGRFQVIDPDGTVIFEAGAFPEFPARLDGKPQVGWVMRRDSGEWAAYCLTNTIGGQQSWNWNDRAQNVVLADDTASGVGLARPYLPLPIWKARTVDWPGTTSATFVDVWRSVVYRQHPRLRWDVAHWADTAGTTGEVRLQIDGTTVGSTLTSTNGTVAFTGEVVDITAIGSHETEHTLTIQARRTAGAGNVRVDAQALWGLQS